MGCVTGVAVRVKSPSVIADRPSSTPRMQWSDSDSMPVVSSSSVDRSPSVARSLPCTTRYAASAARTWATSASTWATSAVTPGSDDRSATGSSDDDGVWVRSPSPMAWSPPTTPRRPCSLTRSRQETAAASASSVSWRLPKLRIASPHYHDDDSIR